jgi:fibronectin type 3 domain-containing protein
MNCSKITTSVKTITMKANKQKTEKVTFIDNHQLESTFCEYCGVDVTMFAHEFWCRFST